MKTLKFGILSVLLLSFILPCSSQESRQKKADDEKVEIYYFHFTNRCATCNAVENETKAVLKEKYSKELEKGSIEFTSLNLDDKKDKALAKKLKVSGQALLLVHGENQVNLTSEGFLNARTNPEKFHKVLTKNIEELL